MFYVYYAYFFYIALTISFIVTAHNDYEYSN